MNMIRALNLMKQDIANKNNNSKLHLFSEIFEYYGPFTKNRLIHFYGHPDCGKTTIAKDLISSNKTRSFVYISSYLDDIKSLDKYNNCVTMISNIFEKTLEFLEKLEPELVDVVIIDNIHNMVSEIELKAAFTTRLDNGEILNKYIKQLSILAAKKKFNIVVFNGINLISNKSRYSHIIEKESVASFEIRKLKCSLENLVCEIIPKKNLMNDNKRTFEYVCKWRNLIWK